MHVTVASEDTQIFNGRKFSKGSNKYFYRTVGPKEKAEIGKARESLHREVWKTHYGDIPEGFVVHHKDHNKNNNQLSNLDLVSDREHRSMHSKEFHAANPGHATRAIGIAQDNCRKWHSSSDGHAWHKQHYEKNKDKLHKDIEVVCECCGKVCVSTDTGRNKYCSRNCKSQARRDSGVDNEVRECLWCKQAFEANKYAKVKYCSRKCGGAFRASKRVLPDN